MFGLIYGQRCKVCGLVYMLTNTITWLKDKFKGLKAKEAAFLVRIFHVFLWRCSKLELRFTRKAG